MVTNWTRVRIIFYHSYLLAFRIGKISSQLLTRVVFRYVFNALKKTLAICISLVPLLTIVRLIYIVTNFCVTQYCMRLAIVLNIGRPCCMDANSPSVKAINIIAVEKTICNDFGHHKGFNDTLEYHLKFFTISQNSWKS